MSRKTGHRDKPELYGQILQHLQDHPEGQNAYSIHQALKVNDATIRLYLSDLVDQGKVVGTAVTKTIISYRIAEEP